MQQAFHRDSARRKTVRACGAARPDDLEARPHALRAAIPRPQRLELARASRHTSSGKTTASAAASCAGRDLRRAVARRRYGPVQVGASDGMHIVFRLSPPWTMVSSSRFSVLMVSRLIPSLTLFFTSFASFFMRTLLSDLR